MSGPKLDLTWDYPGALLVLSWIHCGSWNHLGSLADPSGIIEGSKLDLAWNQFGSAFDPLGILMGPSSTHLGTPWFPRGSLRDHRRVKIGPNLEPAWFLSIHHGSWRVQLDLNWNRFVPSRVPHGSRTGQKLDPNWNRALSEP